VTQNSVGEGEVGKNVPELRSSFRISEKLPEQRSGALRLNNCNSLMSAKPDLRKLPVLRVILDCIRESSRFE
jgi:hypothetical protein